ncbi:MAG: lamin tail domain-containing protein [Myxococcales bacterium]
MSSRCLRPAFLACLLFAAACGNEPSTQDDTGAGAGRDATVRPDATPAGEDATTQAPDTGELDAAVDDDAGLPVAEADAGSDAGEDLCVGVTCTASDPCHNAGDCNSATGLCSNPSKTDGTGCTLTDLCFTSASCQSGVCTGAAPVVCQALDQCHEAGSCDPATGTCSQPKKSDGTACDDGVANTAGDVCTNGVCAGVDRCQGITCTALDACHVAGTCDHATGVCSNPNAPNGTACDDGNAATVNDSCSNGLCGGVDHCVGVTCTALDQCHEVGTCAPATGVCSNPLKANGSACNDGNANTTGDLCTSGTCAGVDHCIGVTCTALDACHVAGTCDHATGACSNPNAPNGTACVDGNPNTTGDVCTNGTCAGVDHRLGVTCTALDACHVAGTCDHATGTCSNPAAPNNTACDDGNPNTAGDVCTNGTCAGVDHCLGVTCTALDACHLAGTCDHATGACSNPAAPNNTACDDGNPNTVGDVCTNGTCAGVDHCLGVTCTALDACHVAGTCDHATGVCSNPNAPNNTACDDGNPNTVGDVCTNGTCAGVDHCVGVTCTAFDQCHVAGTCDHATGVCSNPTAPNGTGCVDGNPDTVNDVCSGGSCTGVDLCATVTCTALDQCHVAGTCDHATGSCSSPAKTDGASCDDSNPCTADACQAGVCSGVPAAAGTDCGGGKVCTVAGACVVPPTVVTTIPADGATGPAPTSIAVTFSKAMNSATLTAQTAAGTCTGSIQASLDDFASCVALGSVAMSGGNLIATVVPAPGLLVNRTYKIRVTATASDSTGASLAAAYTSTTGFTTAAPYAAATGVVISQVYGGGGGSSGVAYKNDFIELHNRGGVAVNLTGWSVQYGSSGGTGAWQVTTLSGTIQPGSYLLIQEGGGTAGATLPTPDITGTLNMSATAGKVALLNSATALSGACPTSASIVDVVGFGGANCSETAGAPAATALTAVVRAFSCTDSNNNSVDFAVGTPTPRNAASAAFLCSPAVNESGATGEIKYCTTQWPLSISGAAGSLVTVYAQVWDDRYAHNDAAIAVQVGYGAATINPEYQPGWKWAAASYDAVVDGNDQYKFDITLPAAGSYLYGSRVSLDGGASWTYCDNHQGPDFGAGSNSGLTFDLVNLGVLTSN